MRVKMNKSLCMSLMVIVMVLVTGLNPIGSVYASNKTPVLTEELVKHYGSPENYHDPLLIIQTSDQGYFFVDKIAHKVKYDTTLVYTKTDSNGNIEWETEYFDDKYVTEHYRVSTAQETSDGGFIIGGYMLEEGNVARAYLLKLSSTGQPEWSKIYGYRNDPISSVKETRDGGFIAASWSGNRSDTAPSYIVKVDRNGNEIWDHYFSYYAEQTFQDVIEMDDGGFLAAGYARLSENSNTRKLLLVKYSASGKVSWHKALNHPFTQGDEPWGYAAQLERKSSGDGYYLLDSKGIWELDSEGKTQSYKVIAHQLNSNKDWIYLNEFIQVPDGFLFKGKHSEFAVTIKTNHSFDAEWSYRFPITFEGYFGAPSQFTPDGGQIWLLNSEDVVKLQKIKIEVDDDDPNEVDGAFFLDSEDYSLSINTMLDIQALFKKPDGSVATVTDATYFTIDNPNIASIDSSGNITGLSPGLTHITAEYQGHRATATLLVVRPYVPNRNGHSLNEENESELTLEIDSETE